MGLYSVFLAVGQIAGSLLGGFAADWRGIDGILYATLGLLAIAIVPLWRLRASSTGSRTSTSPSLPAWAGPEAERPGRPASGPPPEGTVRGSAVAAHEAARIIPGTERSGPRSRRRASIHRPHGGGSRGPRRHRHRLGLRPHAADAAAAGVTVVPLIIRFGDDEYLAGVEMTPRRSGTGCSPRTRRSRRRPPRAPGAFKDVFEACFASGADEIVCIDVGSRLSATFKSATIAAEMLPGRTIEVVDSGTASMGVGVLVLKAAELAAAGGDAASIGAAIRARVRDVDLFVALDTLEYLKKGGRISGTRAAVGTLLSVKPIITIRDGQVEHAERVRTMAKARRRVIELLTATPAERIAILAGPATTRRPQARPARGVRGSVDPAKVTVETVGPSIGPHVGPGFVGGILLRAR